MRSYRQLTSEERYALHALKKQGLSQAAMARALDRHPSTVSRELRRNAERDGGYRPYHAHCHARSRRSRSRRNQRFTPQDWCLVVRLLRQDWSPEQISGRLRLLGILSISHETIYAHIWRDKRAGGRLHQLLRQKLKQRRKRYGSKDSRGRLAGKRPIEERPAEADERTELGHFEGDTIMGAGSLHCALTLVDRSSGYVLVGKLRRRTAEETTRVATRLIRSSPIPVRTLTVDNGTEFHGYRDIEARTGVVTYFANPYHSWERGSNENINGLIRQYLPTRKSMTRLTQVRCRRIAQKLNARPRKRHGFRSPNEVIS